MAGPEPNARSQAWSAYWSSGRLHSCAGSFEGNYGGAIGTFWRTRLVHLAPGARVLDLATGNGPLPEMLALMHGAAIAVDAVYLAVPAPAWHDPSRHPGVRFHAGVDMEALPFADGLFDLVVSQYGFEYADHARALAEVLRVAAPRASISSAP